MAATNAKKILIFYFIVLTVLSKAQGPSFEWAKQIGGTGYQGAWSIAADALGNTYTIGRFSDTVDFDPGIGTYNLISYSWNTIFISKLDVNGNIVWAKTMGGNSDAYGWGISITVDVLGNIYATGLFVGTFDFDPGPGAFTLAAAYADIFVLKLDVNGNFVWAKKMGGPSIDRGYSISVDGLGNVYTTGCFAETGDFNPGPGVFNLTADLNAFNPFISKLDASGNFVWAKRISGQYGWSVKANSTGVCITGLFGGTGDFDPGPGIYNLSSANNSADIFVLKLDVAGNFSWAKKLGGITDDCGKAITLDAVGNVYTTGYFSGLADFDPGPGTSNLSSTGNSDLFISKLDAAGNFVFAKNIGGSSGALGSSIALDVSGNIYTSGLFDGTADFDPGVGTFNITAAGLQDAFISKLDTSGSFVWANTMGGVNDDYANAVAIDVSGNVYSTGMFRGTADFESGPGTFNLTSVGYEDIFIHKLSQCSPITASINVHSILCSNDNYGSATITPSSSVPYTYSWSPAGGTSSAAIGLAAGNYTCTVMNNTCGAVITKTANIIVLGTTPTITATCNPGLICVGETATLNAGGANNYSWSNGGTGASIIVSPSATTVYIVSGTNEDDCSNIGMLYLIVDPCVGLEELKANEEFKLWPNPVSDILTIQLNHAEGNNTVILLNSLGQILLNETPETNKCEYNIRELPAGVYFLRLNNSVVRLLKQ